MFDLLLYGIAFVLILNAFFDIQYFCFTIILYCYVWIRRKLGNKSTQLLQTNSIHGICWSGDMDQMWHMNNARYLRAADFGRMKFWLESEVWRTINEMGGGLVAGAINVRYRRSLQFGDIYKIKSRIVSWDERAFYMEQAFCRQSDGFTCCLVMVKQSLLRVSVSELLAKMQHGASAPEPLPEITNWIQAIECSSDRLRKTL